MTILTQFFGNSIRLKILEVFLENRNDCLNVPEIARQAGVSHITIYNYVNKFLTEGIVCQYPKVNRKWQYKLNLENPKVKIILMFERMIIAEKMANFYKDYPNSNAEGLDD